MFLIRLVLLTTLALTLVGASPAIAATTSAEPTTCPDGGATGFSFPAGTKIKGDVVVSPGVYCSLLDVTVKGDVHAEANAAYLVADLGTLIKGDVSAMDVPSVVLQNTHINGSVQLQNITNVVSLNGPVIGGDVEVTSSSTVVLASSVVNADVALLGNQFVLVSDNFIRGKFVCDENGTVTVPQPNTVLGGVQGQCAGI